jgi:hypothetical protein
MGLTFVETMASQIPILTASKICVAGQASHTGLRGR